MKPIPLTLHGRTYPSISAAGRATGLSRQALAECLAGRSRGPLPVGRPGVPVLIDGVTYGSTAEAARTLKLPYQAVRSRVVRAIDEARCAGPGGSPS